MAHASPSPSPSPLSYAGAQGGWIRPLRQRIRRGGGRIRPQHGQIDLAAAVHPSSSPSPLSLAGAWGGRSGHGVGRYGDGGASLSLTLELELGQRMRRLDPAARAPPLVSGGTGGPARWRWQRVDGLDVGLWMGLPLGSSFFIFSFSLTKMGNWSASVNQ